MKTAEPEKPKCPKLGDLCQKLGVPHKHRKFRKLIIEVASSPEFLESAPREEPLCKMTIREFYQRGWISPSPRINQTSGMIWDVNPPSKTAAASYEKIEAEIKAWKQKYGSLQSA